MVSLRLIWIPLSLTLTFSVLAMNRCAGPVFLINLDESGLRIPEPSVMSRHYNLKTNAREYDETSGPLHCIMLETKIID
ncbi:hypothetical protein BLS_004211 [Venturia inaequalis]|uniref:Secreted protein n=1 Tax=Venturia inaequalis TaxID=5025 RepID=A0A8H3ZAS1_VENIN|nr:hypothetical protein BLS_004211 [Venturia inaequalis]KAE9973957.1 hypothetical protein EG328_004080 [Venturia inaequalis]KAE9989423.1 hypothetical protein EG327_002692 [Venturia inaequalis]